MGSRWDGKIGKIPKISDKREGKRFSPRLTGSEPEFHECRQPDEDYQRSDNGTRRSPGAAELYTPETVGQYKSQWARYERALSLNPAGIIQQGKKIIYKFESCDSITGFWEVEVSSGATYLNIKKRIWQILCPKIVDFDVIDSDGETFTWTQSRGKRTATLDGVVLARQDSFPFNNLVPKLDILTICLNNGCSDNSVEPIVINVQPEGQPELFDSITVYTTPTEIYSGVGFTEIKDNSLKVSAVAAPAYLQKAYVPSLLYDFGFTWKEPSVDSNYVIGYVIQQNTTGQYVDIATVDSTFKYVGKFNSYYRIKTLFSSFGLDYQSVSKPIVYTAPTPKPVVFGDDSTGSPGFSYLNNSFTDLPLSVQKLQCLDTYTSGISYACLNNSFTDIPLSTQRIEVPTDTYTSGVSFTCVKTDITNLDLGNVIIG